jgi:signal transduction histidine kinase
MLRSLVFKWTLTLFLTSLIGVALVGVFAFRTTITEYDRLRSDQARALFIEDMTTYYQSNDGWQGLDDALRERFMAPPVPGMFRPPQQFALVDADGIVVAGFGPYLIGDLIPEDVIAADGTPIVIDGVRVGSALLAEPSPELDPRERSYVDATNRALLIGGVGAGLTALVIGLLLSRQFLRPLSDLKRAITAMHSGDLDQRVPIRTRDELGLLAQTFNDMSANLSRANYLRKQMTADIAHDLRTPLTVIGGYLEALRDGTLKPTPERFRVMSEEVSLLQRLVEDLRTLSLADAGELKLMRTAHAPRDLLERAAAPFRESAEAAGVRLTVECSADLPDLWIDGERMTQVLGNLLTNALRHTPSGGSITLAAGALGTALELTVSDTGSGITPDDLPRVFDRFYRADTARQTDSGESGLGLAIARSIVEAHGGTVRAESTLGQGTLMIISLPLIG